MSRPCGDIGSTNQLQIEVQHSDDGMHKDLCSVFCTCNCCGTVMSVVQILPLIPEKIQIVHSTEIPEYKYFVPSKIPTGIWQPPKI